MVNIYGYSMFISDKDHTDLEKTMVSDNHIMNFKYKQVPSAHERH